MRDRISEADLHAYIDGELTPARAAQVEQHIAAHPAVAARLEADLHHKWSIRHFVQTLPLPPANHGTAHLLGSLGRRLMFRSVLRFGHRVAVVVLSLGLGWGAHALYIQTKGDSVPVFADEAAEAHATLAFAPLTNAGNDLGAVAGLLKSIEEPPDIADQGRASLNLINAYLVPSDDGPAVLLLYENAAKQRISLVISRESQSRDIGLSVAHRDGYTVAFWQNDWTAYALTGVLPDDEAALLAERIRAEFRGRARLS